MTRRNQPCDDEEASEAQGRTAQEPRERGEADAATASLVSAQLGLSTARAQMSFSMIAWVRPVEVFPGEVGI